MIITSILFCDIFGMYHFAKEETGISIYEFERLLNHPIEFNNGCCTAFTSHFAPKIKGAEIEDSSMHMEYLKEFCNIDYGKNYHEFIKYDNKFYDLECLDGVCELKDLPFFFRIKL